ncbi:MAG: radical SAM protein [Elusimicrobia bacterium]|nr:radical SAM protein [Elusimicrobiota bacterium]
MVKTAVKPGINDKLKILSRDSQYDLACACSVYDYEHRTRSENDGWIYPVTFADGRRTYLLKTLISNSCVNDCRYCPLRSSEDPRRVSVDPCRLASFFMDYRTRGMASGIFLSSGVIKSPDDTMDLINGTARILRRSGFKGYIHLKVIPGASDEAVKEAVALASAVSVNIETAGEKHFSRLSGKKKYIEDIIRPIKLISRLTSKEAPYRRVKQTTQFVVGASDETDGEIINYSWRLYRNLGLSRVYFSSYQRGLGETDLPGEKSPLSNREMLVREHRLYQADWLMRKYGFGGKEIPLDGRGNLFLDLDPKEAWARANPSFFPVKINTAEKEELLRVPGLGHVTVDSIISRRSDGARFSKLTDIGKPGKLLLKASSYIKF